MDSVVEFLAQYGYWGMFVSAFIAGSVFPFSSEAVMAVLQTMGLNPLLLLVWGTAGNVGGSMFNYGVGRMGRMEWIEKYLHVKREKVEDAKRFMDKYGAWMGLLCFLPVLGSVIAVSMGYMRANLSISVLSITIGKLLRYAILIYVVSLV